MIQLKETLEEAGVIVDSIDIHDPEFVGQRMNVLGVKPIGSSSVRVDFGFANDQTSMFFSVRFSVHYQHLHTAIETLRRGILAMAEVEK